MLGNSQCLRVCCRSKGGSSAVATMAKLQLLHLVLMQELCSSIADEISDSDDLDRLRAFCVVTNELGYEAYQQSITST